jgi:type I restriction enzyme S subunit
MTKKNDNTPAIRFNGFDDSWEQRKLGECVTFLDTMRKPLKESEREKGIYPYYGASGIVDYVSDYIFDEELVLLSEDGANITDRNYPVCFLASGKYWVNNHAHVLKVNAENENNFICNSLERMDFTQYNSGMAMPKLNKDVCYNIPLFCPVYEEQKQIGDFFRHLDHLITLHQRKCDTLQKFKKSMLQKMFPQNGESVPKIRFAEFTDNWEQRKLGELANVKDSARIPNDLWSDSGVPYIRASDLSNNDLSGVLFLSEETYSFYKNQAGAPISGDLLFNGGGEIGKAVLKRDDKPIYVQGGAVLYVQTSSATELVGEYLESYFQSPLAKKYIDIASAGGTMKHFTLGPSQEMPIIYPSLDEQRKIGDYFRKLDTLITLHQRKLEKLKNIKKSMLEKMFVQ